MSNLAVVKTGGKQYLVRAGETLVVDKIAQEVGQMVELPILATFSENGESIEIGKPMLDRKALCVVVEQGKGDKIRVAKFKAKVRYRKVTGFRPSLTKIAVKSI
ncbi:MAG: 50S ribosomal protein L21 [Patescibacteria group bacterium]